ncbi:hypothetical protein KSP40_PGU020687 [Platanthera guangdongensis]|uniref:Late embryogenesis abundant protein n=1 Tax=Platanthera guangdongensis TaxID=2320717 RepID=A0ABR2LFQ4_9ASPA
MRRSVRSLLQRSISFSSFRCSSKPSLKSATKAYPCISIPHSDLPNPYSSPPRVSSRYPLALQPAFQILHSLRGFCSHRPIEYGREVDEINLKFAEAREEIDAALESKDTVYFDEEAECAREAVKYVLNLFADLLERLPERDKSAVQRSMGLKMEQLKAELKQLED